MKAPTKIMLFKITKLKKKKDYKAITWQFISDHNVPSSVLKYSLVSSEKEDRENTKS